MSAAWENTGKAKLMPFGRVTPSPRLSAAASPKVVPFNSPSQGGNGSSQPTQQTTPRVTSSTNEMEGSWWTLPAALPAADMRCEAKLLDRREVRFEARVINVQAKGLLVQEHAREKPFFVPVEMCPRLSRRPQAGWIIEGLKTRPSALDSRGWVAVVVHVAREPVKLVGSDDEADGSGRGSGARPQAGPKPPSAPASAAMPSAEAEKDASNAVAAAAAAAPKGSLAAPEGGSAAPEGGSAAPEGGSRRRRRKRKLGEGAGASAPAGDVGSSEPQPSAGESASLQGQRPNASYPVPNPPGARERKRNERAAAHKAAKGGGRGPRCGRRGRWCGGSDGSGGEVAARACAAAGPDAVDVHRGRSADCKRWDRGRAFGLRGGRGGCARGGAHRRRGRGT